MKRRDKMLEHRKGVVEKHKITQEEIDFLKELQKEMNTQDTDCQAAPRFWVVIQETKEYVGEDYGSCVDLVTIDGDTAVENANVKDIVDYFMEEYKDDIEENRITINHTPYYCEVFILDEDGETEEEESLHDIDDVIEFFKEHNIITKDYYRTAWYNVNGTICPDTMFITKESCKEHIRLNNYHYCNPRTYAMTAWRSPEVKMLWDILEKID